MNSPTDGKNARAFLEIMRDRYACKLFDAKRPVPDEAQSFILECARLSPSSFGLEHWHLFASCERATIEKLRAACADQDAVGTATFVVVAACRRGIAYDPAGDFVAERGSRFPGGLSVFVDDYKGYWEYLSANGLTDQWARAQCYIACANMMNGARSCGVDSCAIEGFGDAEVMRSLALDRAEWETGIVTSFGYAAEDAPREKIREPLERIVTYV
jgi:nitroreductase